MSFMFNPSPYNDPSAINRPAVSAAAAGSVLTGTSAIAKHLVSVTAGMKGGVIAIDGYPSADFEPLVRLCAGLIAGGRRMVEILDAAQYYRPAEELERQFAPYLPEDKEKDPVLLFGKRLEGGYEHIFAEEAYRELLEKLRQNRQGEGITLLYGHGCAYSPELRELADRIVYLDLAPKEAVLRAKSGRMTNLGDSRPRPFKAMMRRAYYIDFEIALHARKELIQSDSIDYYIDSTESDNYKLIPRETLAETMSALSSAPFRARPVYIEGVWGGHFVKKLRDVSDEMNNIAWVFDFIPMEVSVAARIGGHTLEFPFYTFLQHQEKELLGARAAAAFHGYFPIRFNYDDTFHSNGSMSIQVHSGTKYNREHYNELCGQDESYYIVAAGHDAKTYLGFRDDADPDAFMTDAKRSEREHVSVDYEQYVHAVPSVPGRQVIIPAGTIHASGRNQVVLEIGSLTVGSYTYKLYDYLRLDLDGQPRPIHTHHGENVLAKERNAAWVEANLVQAPVTIREGQGWRERVLGEHELVYFSLRHLEFETDILDDTAGQFHVLSLVGGERVVIESLDNPEFRYEQSYLDIVVVPAKVGAYRIRNLGNQPVIVHKTMLKENFEHALE
ncbi:MAG: yvyI [Paenibacillus sp.]|jgi:mannose-6-phosphate isomerase class I|nr:yvyI [Paenibacillus sp.]